MGSPNEFPYPLSWRNRRTCGETASFDCRGRRPRRPEKQQILLFIRLPIIAGCKLKILSFPGRRGRRSLQAKNQTASIRRYGAKTLSFPGRRVLVASRSRSRSDTTPWCHSLRLRRFATSTPTGKNSNRIDTPLHHFQLISVSTLGNETPPFFSLTPVSRWGSGPQLLAGANLPSIRFLTSHGRDS